MRDSPIPGSVEMPAHRYRAPTSASWMNQVETWFSILSRQAIRRGSFENVRALVAAIERFTRKWNTGASPFKWVKTADEILARRAIQAGSSCRLRSSAF